MCHGQSLMIFVWFDFALSIVDVLLWTTNMHNSWYESVDMFYCISVYMGQLGGVPFQTLCGDLRHMAYVSPACLS